MNHTMLRAASVAEPTSFVGSGKTSEYNANYTVDLTSIDIEPGDICVVMVGMSGSDTHTLPDFTNHKSIQDGGQDYFVMFTKVLDGNETTITSTGMSAVSYNIAVVWAVFRGFSSVGTAEQWEAAGKVDPNPPEMTGIVSGEWLVIAGYKYVNYTPAAPASYTFIDSQSRSTYVTTMMGYDDDPTVPTDAVAKFTGGVGTTDCAAMTARLII